MSEERFDYEVDDATRFVDNLKDRVHDLYDKNEELKEENERLNKGYCKFKEQCGKYAMCLRENQLKEIERLNNIINELEKYSKDRYYEEKKLEHYSRLNAYKDIWNKIKELKGSDNNELRSNEKTL